MASTVLGWKFDQFEDDNGKHVEFARLYVLGEFPPDKETSGQMCEVLKIKPDDLSELIQGQGLALCQVVQEWYYDKYRNVIGFKE